MPRNEITPPPPGSFCAICWGSGRPFGAGPTPSVVTIQFSGIEKGDLWVPADGEPPNNNYRLEQSSSCVYEFLNADTAIFLEWRIGSVFCRMIFNSVNAFLIETADPCILVLETSLFPPGVPFQGGEATILL
ncbi:hypothetical protein KAR91_85685 [Candidatus Pacearchaeota archaeon]|nr:hypothetical protein [Candidatus Pacearchaeota archaeon]